METVLVPCLTDNYAYLVFDPSTKKCGVVDPAEADPVARAVEERGWTLTHIFNTHHHHDHVGGNEALKARYGATIFAPISEKARITTMDVGVREGEDIPFGDLRFWVMETPGHTSGHIVFHVPEAGHAFTGDTLFSMGCGRLFEGTAQQMWTSLQKLMTLPDKTKIFCGHEYTLSNAKFALTLEPSNQALQDRADEVADLRKNAQPSIPTTMGLEKRTNPFLRPHSTEIRSGLDMQRAEDVDVFAKVRQLKDSA